MDQAAVIPRRIAGPDNTGVAKLELLHQPLYSAVAIAGTAAALPRELNFFNYGIGGTVTGAGSGAVRATTFHTNLEAAAPLASPKTFSIYGVRIIGSILAHVAAGPLLSDQSFELGRNPNEQHDDLFLIHYSTSFVLRVGNKDYLRGPTMKHPANTGIEGVVDAAISTTAAAVGAQQRNAIYTAGRYFGLETYPILLAPQQSWTAQLLCQWGTNPTPVLDRYVFCVFDGLLGREVL